jgi:hypothetical protein
MIDRIRYIWQLLVLASVLTILGILIVPHIGPGISVVNYLLALGCVTIVNLATFLIMYTGINKNNREGMIYLIGGIGVKFLLYLLIIMLFWIVTKNLSKAFILTFFALYLIFTFFTVAHLLKLLKDK